MNTHEAKEGFKTFLLLAGVVGLAVVAYKGVPQGYQYLTQARKGSDIINPQVFDLTARTVTIAWETVSPAQGIIVYGETPDQTERRAPETPTTAKGLKHQVTIENLKPRTTYYYRIGAEGRPAGEDLYQFTTPQETRSE